MSTASTSTTSRVARKPVTIPSGVNIQVEPTVITIKGPKGQLTIANHPSLDVIVEEGKLKIQPQALTSYCRSGSGKKLLKSIPGTLRSRINNAVTGVTEGFVRKLNLVGVGYRAQAKGDVLNLTLGFSHPVEFRAPEGVSFETPSLTEILIKGTDKHLVGHTAAKIQAIRPPEPYKGKGIIDPLKRVIRKETKKK